MMLRGRRMGLPALGSVAIVALPRAWEARAREWALWASIGAWLASLGLWLGFDRSVAGYQYVAELAWWPGGNTALALGVDGISIFFVLLTTLLWPICLLSSWEAITRRRREYYALLLAREALVLLVFTARDLLAFYVSFEAVLIPRFLIMGIWGSRARKMRAAYFFFLYTLAGSVLRLLALLLLYFEAGTRDRVALAQAPLSEARQLMLWVAFFAALAAKVPRVPVHIWLPEAHVEAPTAGSVLLAGVLLKLGSYGLRRLSLPLLPAATLVLAPAVRALACVGVVYTSLTAVRQGDRKRVIAYASVAHRNRTLLGLFARTQPGLEGAIYQGLSHGVVSGALFLCVGVLYDRHHTRRIAYYGGLATVRPRFMALFLLFTRANIALPGTSSFVGEFLMLVGLFGPWTIPALLGGTGRMLGGAYSLWLFNRVAYGNLKGQYIGPSPDLTRREWACLAPLAFLVILGGLYPEPVLDTRRASCAALLEQVRLRG